MHAEWKDGEVVGGWIGGQRGGRMNGFSPRPGEVTKLTDPFRDATCAPYPSSPTESGPL